MNWYCATFFEEESENEYEKFSNDSEAIERFEEWAKANELTLAEIYKCNEEILASVDDRIY